MRRPVALAATVLATLLWSSSLIAAPSIDAPRFSALMYAAGSLVCHQRSERSFYQHGAQFPVCARCLGVYVGAAAGAFGWLVIAGVGASPRRTASRMARNARSLLLIAMAPTLITVTTGAVGVWDPGGTIRAVLALPAGAAIAAVIAAAAAGDLR